MKKIGYFAVSAIVVLLAAGCSYSSGDIDFETQGSTSSEIVWEFSSEAKAKHHDIFSDEYLPEEKPKDTGSSSKGSIFDDDYSSGTEEPAPTVSEKEPPSDDYSSKEVSSREVSSKSTANDSEYDPLCTTMRERLSGKDAEMYDTLCSAFSNYELRVVLDGEVESEKLDYIYRCISDDHPEFFWVPYGYRGGYYMEYRSGKTLVEYDSLGDMNKDNIPVYKEKFDKCVDEIVNSIPSDLSLYDKILYIHDYIVLNCDYVEGSDTCYSAYGCLVEKKAVCSGYTPAFQLLLHKIGVECGNVVGFATSNGGAHTWNYVRYDGNYYWVDITWDDPISDVSDYEGTADISHSYFFITSEQLERTHAISAKESPFIPACTATDYCYMKVTGNYMDEYSFDEFNKLVSEKEGNLAIQFGSREAFVEAIQDLIYNRKLFETDYYSKSGVISYKYLIDEESLIIEFST